MGPAVSFFPKFLPTLSATELGEVAGEAGVDAVDVIIREGFPVTPENLSRNLAAYRQKLEATGVRADFAVTPFTAAQMVKDIDTLMAMADAGIRSFRLGYFDYRNNVRAAMREARDAMERLAPLCALSGIRAVYQVHHNTLVTSASGAYLLVRDLGPEAISVQLDTGNQAIEGYEPWPYGVRLLGKHLHSVGIKDIDGSGNWVECGKGTLEFAGLFDTLSEVQFAGYLNLMPFFAEDPKQLSAGLRREVALVREHVARREAKWLHKEDDLFGS